MTKHATAICSTRQQTAGNKNIGHENNVHKIQQNITQSVTGTIANGIIHINIIIKHTDTIIATMIIKHTHNMITLHANSDIIRHTKHAPHRGIMINDDIRIKHIMHTNAMIVKHVQHNNIGIAISMIKQAMHGADMPRTQHADSIQIKQHTGTSIGEKIINIGDNAMHIVTATIDRTQHNTPPTIKKTKHKYPNTIQIGKHIAGGKMHAIGMATINSTQHIMDRTKMQMHTVHMSGINTAGTMVITTIQHVQVSVHVIVGHNIAPMQHSTMNTIARDAAGTVQAMHNANDIMHPMNMHMHTSIIHINDSTPTIVQTTMEHTMHIIPKVIVNTQIIIIHTINNIKNIQSRRSRTTPIASPTAPNTSAPTIPKRMNKGIAKSKNPPIVPTSIPNNIPMTPITHAPITPPTIAPITAPINPTVTPTIRSIGRLVTSDVPSSTRNTLSSGTPTSNPGVIRARPPVCPNMLPIAEPRG